MQQQFKEDMIKLEKLLDTAVAQYQDGYPIHLSNPMDSAITVISESQFQTMSTSEVLYLLRYKHILITDCAVQALQFNRDGLRTLCSPRDTIEVHGTFRISLQLQRLIPGDRSIHLSRP
jgi:hypothetical protein